MKRSLAWASSVVAAASVGLPLAGPLLGFVAFLVFGCFSIVLGFVFVRHVLPALAKDLADLTWRLVRLCGGRGR